VHFNFVYDVGLPTTSPRSYAKILRASDYRVCVTPGLRPGIPSTLLPG